MKLGVSVDIWTFLAVLPTGGPKNGKNVKQVIFLMVLKVHKNSMMQRQALFVYTGHVLKYIRHSRCIRAAWESRLQMGAKNPPEKS